MDLEIGPDDPRRRDVVALLDTHLGFHRAASPPEHVHALDLEGLCQPSVTFVSARRDGVLVGIGAIKELDDTHGELKSMHTVEAVRGEGIGRAIVDHLVGLAVDRHYRRVSLETGAQAEYEPARRMYERAGFTPCEPFGSYTSNRWSMCMTRSLEG